MAQGLGHVRPKTSAGDNLSVRMDGLRETLAAFRQLPKDANDELRDATLDLATLLANAAAQSARSEGRQAALMAPLVKARRDRIPIVVVGGTKRVGRNKKPAYKLLFGSEFGSSKRKQYKPHQGKQGYWFFPTVEKEAPAIGKKWDEVAQNILARFAGAS